MAVLQSLQRRRGINAERRRCAALPSVGFPSLRHMPFGNRVRSARMTPATPKADERKRLEALAAFAPEFRKSDAGPGQWVQTTGSGTKDNLFQMTWFSHSKLLSDFIQTTYKVGWVVSFDWAKWARGSEGELLRNDRSALASATPKQLSKLLTAMVRADRFVEGSLAADWESGLLRAVCERAEALLADTVSPSPLQI
jgi:hypothetical protein